MKYRIVSVTVKFAVPEEDLEREPYKSCLTRDVEQGMNDGFQGTGRCTLVRDSTQASVTEETIEDGPRLHDYYYREALELKQFDHYKPVERCKALIRTLQRS